MRGRRYIYELIAVAGALLFFCSCQRQDIYVSPDGDDSADGTIENPYRTIAKAITEIRPGETIYLREGTYKPTAEEAMGGTLHGLYLCVYMLDASGSEFRPLTISGYEDEKVTIDLSGVVPENQRVSGFQLSGDYWRLRKFDIVGIQVTQTGHTQSENITLTGSNCIIDRVNMHDGMGIGLYAKSGRGNLVLNCDAYNNYDPVSENGKGGNCDGFGFHLSDPQCTGNVIRGCRAWRNSDDGFDLINNLAEVEIDSCWSWQNGYDSNMTARADGSGFKMGGYGLRKMAVNPVPPMNVVKNSIAWENKNVGFYSNHHLGGIRFENNRSGRNNCNYNFVNQIAHNDNTDVGGYGHVIKNNVSYRGARGEYTMIDPSQCTVEGNTFLPDMALTDSSFVSVDPALLYSQRQKDGSLPDIDFLRLRQE